MVAEISEMQSIVRGLSDILEKMDQLGLHVAAAHVQAGLDAVRSMTDLQVSEKARNHRNSEH